MITNTAGLAEILDRDLIGFLTAVNEQGQPQTAPVWFVRDGDDLVVYNQPTTPRLTSIAANPRVSFVLRGDPRGSGMASFEGSAAVEDLPPAKDFPGYLEKYAGEIEHLGWTPESFSEDYRIGVRITITRVRTFGLEHV